MSVSITFALSFGPNGIAKRPHPEARPARMRMRKRPFHNVIRAGKAPFRGGGGPVVDWRPKKKERIRAPFANAKIRYFKADRKSAMKKHYGVMVCLRCGLRLIRCSLQVFHRVSAPFRVFHEAETESLVEPFGLWVALVHKQSGARKVQPGRFLAGGAEQG